MNEAERQASLARIQKLRATEETNTSTIQHVANVGITVGMMEAAKEQLEQIPSFLYPDNPAKDSLLPGLAYSSWSFILACISPVALLLSWKNTYDACVRFKNAENKNFERVLDILVSLTTSVLSTVLFIVGGAKIAVSLILGIFALNAAYSTFNTVKNLIYAGLSNSKEERNHYLFNAGKQFISAFTNTMGHSLTFLLGVKMSNPGDGTTFQDLGAMYSSAATMLTQVTLGSILGIAADNPNQRFSNLFKKPQILTDIATECREHPFRAAVSVPIMAAVSIATVPFKILAIAIQLPLFGIYKAVSGLASGIAKAYHWFRPSKKEVMAPALTATPESPTKTMIPPAPAKLTEAKEDKFKKLVKRIQAQVSEYEKAYPDASKMPERVRAKDNLLTGLLANKFSVTPSSPEISTEKYIPDNHVTDSYEDIAKEESPYYKNSFFRNKGRVAQILEDVRELDKDFSQSAAPAA